MFIGHYAVGFGAKSAAPKLSLGVLLAAPQLLRSVPGTVLVEDILFAAGLVLYTRATRARDAAGRWILAALVLFLLGSYFFAAFGPPPPNVTALAWGSLALWLVPVWGWWIERHREPA